MAHVGANVAELEGTLNRYRATLVEIESHMKTIFSIADGLETMDQQDEVKKLEEALTVCAKSHSSVSNQIKALTDTRHHSQVTLSPSLGFLHSRAVVA